ncbi:MAG: nitrogenase iron-molybdenum cofactor biosynthesis protein NifN [Calditerrivibrio sp.]|nr:nitrogenase iron-molybdenum cofactor biosynthesis protein NifN [Calditerrivibrio sp.]
MNISINPLKKSQLLGATLAVLGFDGFLPFHHGAQGCTAFIKNILTQHFKEIIPVQTTAVYNISAIMGSYSELVDGLKNVVESSKPKGICILTTSLTQLRGDDINISITEFRKKYPEYNDIDIFIIPTNDFNDDAEKGFAFAISEIFETITFNNQEENTLIIIGNFSLTPQDIDEIKYIVESFGIKPYFVPDLSETLGSINDSYYKLPTGGTKYSRVMNKPLAAIGIGSSTTPILNKLKNHGIQTKVFPSLLGLTHMDDFLDFLYISSGKKPSKHLVNQRKRLIDTMMDAHFYLGQVKIAIAIEPDMLYALYYFLNKELGISTSKCITTYKREDLNNLLGDNYDHGDLYAFEKYALDADIIISNSHAELISEKYNNHLYKIGFPVKDEIAYHLKKFVGYEGSMHLLRDIANISLKILDEKSYHYKNYKGVKYESCIL